MPDTGHVAQHWAKEIVKRLEAGALSYSAETAKILKAYFANRIALEAEFVAALEAGQCRDYQHFMHTRLDRFYRL
jgi:hypothetical protein